MNATKFEFSTIINVHDILNGVCSRFLRYFGYRRSMDVWRPPLCLENVKMIIIIYTHTFDSEQSKPNVFCFTFPVNYSRSRKRQSHIILY